MVEYVGSKEKARLDELVHQAEMARRKKKKTGKRDQWGFRPVGRGWLRGHACNVRYFDEAGEFGILLILEFDLRTDREVPGVPVRMTATEFNHRIGEGQVVDVRDSTPKIRPITPHEIYFVPRQRDEKLIAHYPGRRQMTRRVNLLVAVATIGAPIVLLFSLVALFSFYFHVFSFG